MPTLRASTRHAGHAVEAQPPRRAKAASGGTTTQPLCLVDAVSKLGSLCLLPAVSTHLELTWGVEAVPSEGGAVGGPPWGLQAPLGLGCVPCSPSAWSS